MKEDSEEDILRDAGIEDISELFDKCYFRDRSEWSEKRLRMMRIFPNAPVYNRLPERFRDKDRLGDFAKMLIKMEAVCVAIEEGRIDVDELVVRYNLVTGI